MRATFLTAGLAAVLLTGVAACSSSSGSGHTAGTGGTGDHRAGKTAHAADACNVVTREQAATALGEDVAAGEVQNANPNALTTGCMFAAPDGANVGLQVGTARILKALASGPGSASIPDLGDEAFGSKGEVFARKGDVGVLILVVQGAGDVESRAEVLASQALANL